MAYASQTDLEYAVGGAARLVELLDKDGDGYADLPFVTRILDRATAEVQSAIQVSTDLSTLSTPPPSLIFATAGIAAYYAYLEGTAGHAVPEAILANHNDALRWLDQVARRERSLGSVPRSTTDQAATQIDPDPYGCSVSRRGLRGFW
jgi:phage gp36-like protein